MRKSLLNFLKIIIGVSIIIIVFFLFGFANILEVIRNVSLVLFFIGVFFYAIRNLVGTWRMKIILANFEHNISFFNTFKAHMGGILASDYTPSRTGYFYASLILKKNDNIPLPTGLSSVVSSNAAEFTFKVIGVVCALF